MNKMTALINKIERRLGTKPLNLPEELTKDHWSEIISQDTLYTFSRYFPNQIKIDIEPDRDITHDGYCVIDRNLPDGIEILGVKDVDWQNFSNDSMVMQQSAGYGIYDMLSNQYGLDDAMMLQMRADHLSLFNYGFYVEFKPPNKVKITNVTGSDLVKTLRTYPLFVYLKHADNLMTISPTKMELFENLATADVALYLSEYLKHYDGLETVFATVDIKLDTLRDWAGRRQEYIEEMKNAYVGAANDNAPLIITMN